VLEQSPPPISTLELNRASLARQFLLQPAETDVAEAVSALGALQAQEYAAPLVALWSRLGSFRQADLSAALADSQIVYATLMRGTLHLIAAPDYPTLAAVAQERWRSLPRGAATTTDVDGIRQQLHTFCAARRSRQTVLDWIEALAARGEIAAADVANLRGTHNWRAFTTDPLLLRVPDNDDWDARRPDGYVTARVELPPFEQALTGLVRRYLRAFGPAGVDDIASFSGESRVRLIRAALSELEPELISFTDDNGRRVYDLQDSPRPTATTDAPVRFLARFDSLLLAYAPRNRHRILADAYRDSVVIRANGQVLGTYLVDGFVAGTWTVRATRQAAVLTLCAFEPVAEHTRSTLLELAESLVRLVAPTSRAYSVCLDDSLSR